jgi:hypothetical protein
VTSRDRVLAWSLLAGGGASVALVTELCLATPAGNVSRRPWSEVDKAVWDADSRTLAVWWAGRRRPTPLELMEVRRFPVVVQDRVRSSIVLSTRVDLADGRWVVAAVRRGPGEELRLRLSPGPGVRRADPAVESQVRPVALALAEEAGVPVDQDLW